jgi:hypothetical protein
MSSEHHEHQVPIWFFVGTILLTYGILIVGAGVYALWFPTEVEQALKDSWPGHNPPWFFLHPDIWWGAVMVVVGLIYCIRFNPIAREETITGEEQ